MKEISGRTNNPAFLKNINPTTSPLSQPRLSHQPNISSSTTSSKILGGNMDDLRASNNPRGNTPGNSSTQYSNNSPYSPYAQSGNTSPYNQNGAKSPYSPLSPKAETEVKKKIPTFLEQKTNGGSGMKGSLFMNEMQNGEVSSPMTNKYPRGSEHPSYNSYKPNADSNPGKRAPRMSEQP